MAIMNGFNELWAHYRRSIESLDTPQRSAWVLLTTLFLVKLALVEMTNLVIVPKMQDLRKNECDALIFWSRTSLNGGEWD